MLQNLQGGLQVVATNEYSEISPVYTPHFEVLVEPFRETVLTAYDSYPEIDGVRYEWLVNANHIGEGESIRFQFNILGKIPLTVRRQLNGAVLAEKTVAASCKYVRREIRTLTEADREVFFSAVSVLQNVPTEEGQRRWGYKYKDKDYFNRLHLYYGADRDCDHWHEGPGFVTSHMAITLEFEQSLQAVNPMVTVPYWDFTLESTFYNTETWRQSPVFGPQWFGTASPDNEWHTVTEGRWAFVPTMANARNFSRITNSYGLLRAPWNNDPTPFMTRHDHVYGFFNNLEPRGCDGYAKCLEFNTWSGVATCLNTDAHGHIHELIGGSWNHRSHRAKLEEVSTQLLPSAMDFVHITQALSKELWRKGFMQCPTYCAMDTPSSECACTCDAARYSGLDSSAYTVLRDSGVLYSIHFQDSTSERILSYFDETTELTEYKLLNKTADEEGKIFDALLGLMCDPGHIGEMFQATSTNDVTFWVLHPTLDRLWHWIRLQATPDTFTDDWADGNTCYGHNPNDYQPFTGDLFNLANKRNDYLTNRELYNLFDPGRDAVPYIYDNYEWPHCNMLGYDMTFTGSRSSYSEEQEAGNTAAFPFSDGSKFADADGSSAARRAR
jgi:hypothetical protein